MPARARFGRLQPAGAVQGRGHPGHQPADPGADGGQRPGRHPAARHGGGHQHPGRHRRGDPDAGRWRQPHHRLRLAAQLAAQGRIPGAGRLPAPRLQRLPGTGISLASLERARA
ncbi:hypothetical protein MTBUT4_630003 [Magnetospirillum sp. UT-4]|nr:hypothetical protein MTBUT4_630003 [Magnetospirillum sp. UT-4]